MGFLGDLKFFLEKIDFYRDKVLFVFIKPFWPRFITPNHLTYLRIVIGLFLAVLLFFFGREDKVLIISLFCFGAITDLFDGSVARGLSKETEFGALIDPAADRVLILPIATYSLFRFHKWLLLALLLTEVVGAIVSLYYKSKVSSAKANIFGKTRMVLLSVVFAAILLYWPASPSLFFINIIWFSLVFSFLSIFARLMDLNKKNYETT